MNIYVGNLPWSIDDQQLEDLFKEHGEVTSAQLLLTVLRKDQEALVLLKWKAELRMQFKL